MLEVERLDERARVERLEAEPERALPRPWVRPGPTGFVQSTRTFPVSAEATGPRASAFAENGVARSRELKRVPLEMKQLAEQIVADLVLTPGRERLRAVVADLPPVHADRDMSATVLRHLVSNAIRFSASSLDPVVEVGFDRGTDGPVYFVRDNGIGFDSRYADKLFNVFHRMDGPPEPGRTGIGLAIVKRIVERHGGRVWARGELGRGATIYFTLPAGNEPETAVATT